MNNLRPNKKLLNHKFNGYKLASTMLDNHVMPLAAAVNEPSRNVNQYSYNYTRCREMHNHLHIDEWNGTVYFVDSDCRITTMLYSDDGTPSALYQVSMIPQKERVLGILSCTLVFPCETMAVVCDGGGSVYLVYTGHRKKDELQNWKPDNEKVCYDFDRPTHILQGTIEKDILHLLALTLEERKGSGTLCVFYWLQIKLNFEDPSESLLKGVKRFMGKVLPKALWLSKDYAHVWVASSKPFHLVNEDLERVEPPQSSNGHASENILYEWTQSKELVTITFLLCVTENEVECEIKHNYISVKLKNGKKLLEGNLEKEITRDASRWYVEKNKLELVLIKKNGGEFWNAIVPADTCGSHVIEGEEEERIQEIGAGLSHLTSENEELPQKQDQTFNMEQLEECDNNEEETKLYSVDVFTGEVVSCKDLTGHQWLFSNTSNTTLSPIICLRHNVDGIIWQANDLSEWEHKATFDAFGYVHASKQECKYTSCTPNFKFAFITDCTSHLYTYESDQTNPCQHNQYVSRFADSNKILGCQATNSHLYILSDKDLNILTLPS